MDVPLDHGPIAIRGKPKTAVAIHLVRSKHLEARGKTFSLRDFHDRLLGLGLPPSLAREVLLSDKPR